MFKERRLENECRRYWFYADLCSTGVFYDTGSGVLLWGAGQKKKCSKYDDGMCGNINSYKCDDYPIGMAYVPWQTFQNIYDPERALDAGTMFVELDKPFYGRRAFRR